MRRRPLRRARPALLPIFALAVAGCGGLSGGGYAYLPPETPRERDGLVLVTEWADFDVQYLKPDVDFTGYRAIWVAPLQLAYTPAYQRDHRLDRWQQDERMVPDARADANQQEDLVRLDRVFRESVERILGKGLGFQTASARAPGVLLLAAEVVDLDLRAGRVGELEPGGSGWDTPPTVIVAAQLRDAETDERLAELLQAHPGTGGMQPGLLFWADVDDAFDRFAEDLRVMLQRHGPGLADRD